MNRTKRHVRLQAKKALAQLSPAQRQEKSWKLSALLNSPMQGLSHLVWGVYAPLPDEPRWQGAIANLEQFALAWPRLEQDGKMAFLRCQQQQLIPCNQGGRQLMAPPPSSPPAQPQALLVPGLGFTERGERLGRGGGDYDRVLGQFLGLSVGLCFEQQLHTSLPLEAHDQRVEIVVTDERVIDNRSE